MSAPSHTLNESDESRAERFVQLQAKYQQRVFSFVLTLVPHWADAEEVMQETNLVLWRKFQQFVPGSDFVKWANQVAYYEVLKFRKRARHGLISASEDLLAAIADEVNEANDVLQNERERVVTCLGKLSGQDRKLVHLRYRENTSVQQVAESLGRSADSVYKSLQRVRRILLGCVRRLEQAEER